MNLEKIHAAASRAEGHVRRTPLLTSPFLDEIAGRRVWVKAECLQHTGSFKFRGAWSSVSSLSDEERAQGIFASSSGNHAQAIALAAKMHGAQAVILMPSDAPRLKIENTEALGAEVVLYNRETEDREVLAPRLATKRQLTFIPPFDHPEVIAGQGTCGLEIHEQAPEGADVLVCCSGGGLTAGIALALEGTGRKVHPVEPEHFDDVARSLKAGERLRNEKTSGSICDAIITPQAGDLTWPIIQRLCAPGIVVTEEEALKAMALAWLRLKIVVEPGGAVALAAALFHGGEIEGDDIALTVSGGNVDADMFRRALDTL